MSLADYVEAPVEKSLNMEHSECKSTRMLHGVETFLDDMGIFCKDDIACPSESCFYCTDLRLASSDTSKICHKVSPVCPLKQTVQYWRKQFSHQSLP